MIDEGALTTLMAEAAASAPAPGGVPDAFLHAVAPARVASRRPPRRLALGVAAVALLALAASLVAVGDGTRRDRRVTPDTLPPFGLLEADDGFASDATGGSTVTGGASNVDGARQRAGGGAATGGSGAGTGGAVGQTAAPQSTDAQAPPADAPRVVKTGSVDVEVPKGAFDRAVSRVVSIATGLGGYVSESTTSESDDDPRGTVTVRVPADSFERLLGEVRKLGDIESVTSKGTDVTAQFTDLSARLGALSATRDRLFEVLRGTRNVGDIIAVHDRITGVQTEIEQLQGQQRLLTDQASFGTLAVGLSEPGAARVEPASSPDDGLGHAWEEARRRFGDGFEGLLAWSGSAAVVLVVAVAILVLGRLAWRRGRRRFV